MERPNALASSRAEILIPKQERFTAICIGRAITQVSRVIFDHFSLLSDF